MGDELLPYYDRELAFIRDLGQEFAQANPKIATRLGMGQTAIKDAHVELLVEAFAYLNARIRYKLDDDFPELSDALLGVLYPHYLAPVPSMAIVQFQGQPELTAGYELAQGTVLETDPIEGEPCRFRTCYPVTLWPVQLESASLSGRPLPAPTVPQSPSAQAVLRLVLRCTAKDLSFAKLAPLNLRFFLKGQEQYVFPLYDLLCNDPLQVALASRVDDPAPVLLGPDCLRPVGFARDEGLLPYPPRAFLGYRLLTEFFAFPEKFLFLELQLDGKALSRFGNHLEIFIYTSSTDVDVERTASADTFALGCTPMVNLYTQPAEPIFVSHTQSEYEVIPDARRRQAMEVYAINRVTASDSAGQSLDYLPFYGAHHAGNTAAARCFWHASRRPARHYAGTEMFLALVDLDFNPAAPAEQTLRVETTCLNRDLPNRLPFGGGQPHLQLRDSAAPLSRIVCLTPPTPTLRPPLGKGALWRLLSHLSLNHLSLTDPQEGTRALQEILKLYDYQDSPRTRAMIEGIARLTSRTVSGRVPGRGFDNICRGTEIIMQFDEMRFAGKGLLLFASLLERFLALYCSLNSFTRLTATVQGGEKVLHRWPPRAGEQTLL